MSNIDISKVVAWSTYSMKPRKGVEAGKKIVRAIVVTDDNLYDLRAVMPPDMPFVQEDVIILQTITRTLAEDLDDVRAEGRETAKHTTEVIHSLKVADSVVFLDLFEELPLGTDITD